MKIKAIKINNYGNLENKEINLEKNINIIYGKNESGKSTLLNYIKNIFYGISKNKNGREISDYDKYKSWGKEDFSGKLKYELDNGEEFEIYRDFNKKKPKIFNSELEDISKQFDIVKKDGIPFFYEQTNMDEAMFTSTVLSMQKEVKLNSQDQSVLIQKLANLAGTGDDNLSYNKIMDKLNKKQIEEVGTDRSQGRPINIVREKLRNLQLVLKELEQYQNNNNTVEERLKIYSDKMQVVEIEIELAKELNIIKLCKQSEEEKINIKEKYAKEKIDKIEENNNQKNNIIMKNKNVLEKNNKINKKYFLVLFLILTINILIYIINKNYLKNNIINTLNFLIIPIYLILIFIIEKNKNYKIKKEKEKIKNEINLIEKQIEILNEEKNKIEKEIKNEQIEIDNKIEIKLEKLKNKFKEKIDINKYLEKMENEDLNNYIYNLQEEFNKYKLEVQTIKLQESDKSKKIEKLASIKEENELLEEELKDLEEKNKSINLTKEILTRAYIKMKNNITPKFTENLSQNINKISNGKYTKVAINDEKGLIVENEYGEYIPAERLSIGTIDQLYLSLRLSMIEELSEEKMPIMLDEAFAYFDDFRLENILKFLSENMKEHQVLIFTCTRREKEILDKLNIKYNYVEM